MGIVVNLEHPLVNLTCVAALFGCCTRTMMRRVEAGDFPEPIRVGRKPFWPREEIEQFLNASRTEKTA